jgi:hypothetical protein
VIGRESVGEEEFYSGHACIYIANFCEKISFLRE